MTDVSGNVDILVAGAGIAGLALATALGRAGYRVGVLEAGGPPQLPPPADDLGGWDCRVSALTPSSTGFFEQLGVLEYLLDKHRAAPYTRMHVWDAEGTGQIEFSATDSGVPALGHIIENRLTVDALLMAAQQTPGVILNWNQTVTTLGADSAGYPVLTCESGLSLSAPLVVGADGARSRLRSLADFPVRRWSYGQRAIVATVALDDNHHGTCWQAFLRSGPLALLPLASPRYCSIVWSLDDDDSEHWAGVSDQAFIHGLNQAMAGHGPRVVAVGQRSVFPLTQCHAIDYVQPGIALVADAAHSIHPLAGQGINLGLADVAVLAEELERALRLGLEPGAIEVLARYQRRRKGENLGMMAAMEAFKRGFGSNHPLLRVARNAGLDWVNGLAPLKQWFVRRALD